MYEPIAIIGLAGRFAGSPDLDTFWQDIASGRDLVRPFPQSRIKELEEASGIQFHEEIANGGYLDTISQFEPEYFNISREECKYIDPQQRLVLELTEEAIQSTGIGPGKLAESGVGVFMASSINTYALGIGSMPMGVANSSEAAMAGRVSYIYNFSGPSLTVNTESSSVSVALHYACVSLQQQECNIAVVGGGRIHIIPPGKQFVYENMMTSGTQKIKAFDKDADGIIAGEGGGVLILKRLANALQDNNIIYGVIKGTGVNSNGARSIGLSAPNQDAQADLICKVIEKSGIDPLTISYIEAHGTGTTIGDPIEIAGITRAFNTFTDKTQYIPIATVKTNIGHLGSAAGIAGLLKTIMALIHKKIPPSLHFKEPNPHIDFRNSPVYVNTSLIPWETRGPARAGVNSLGLTGTNAYVILEEPPPPRPGERKRRGNSSIFTFSAKTRPSLQRMLGQFGHWLEKSSDPDIDDAAYTLNTGRRPLEHRIAVMAEDNHQLTEKCKDLGRELKPAPGIYCNNGSFIVRPASLLPVFITPGPETGDSIRCDEFFQQQVFHDHYHRCITAQPVDNPLHRDHFAFQYALWQLLKECGIAPKAVLGVGAGKPTADVIQGKITFEQGLETASRRTGEETAIDAQKLEAVLNKMLDKKYNLFFIIGGRNRLAQMVGSLLKHQPHVYFFNLDLHHHNLLEALCRLYILGVNPDWETFYHRQQRQPINLPAYPFDRKSYLLKTNKFKSAAAEAGTGAAQESEPRDTERQNTEQVQFDDILAIFQDVVSHQLDLEEDYVDNNGNSIGVMQIITIVKENYHTTINIDQFYGAATLRELITRIRNQVLTGAEIADSTTTGREEEPRGVIWSFPLNPSAVSAEQSSPGNIFLTGGSGFLGSQLLKDLLERTDSAIYCLARGDTPNLAREHCLDMWSLYFPGCIEPHLDKRVFIVKGDITHPALGIDDSHYRELSQSIDTVIHCAADVRHYGKYQPFRVINVEGTRNIVRFCTDKKQKRLHHVSTKAIAEYPREDVVLKENDLDVGQVFRGRVYARSKFEAEQSINQARARGLNAAVYRIGDLTGRYSDGVFQQNIETNRFYNNLKALVLLKKIFNEAVTNLHFELSPVDLCTRAIINLILLRDSVGYNFHLMNPFLIPLKLFLQALENLGFYAEEVDYETFSHYVDEELRGKGFVKELSWISYLLSLDEYASLPNLSFDCNFTLQVLEKTGFTWPDMDVEYLEKIIRHGIAANYISLEPDQTGGNRQ